jgi:hypothetical protein
MTGAIFQTLAASSARASCFEDAFRLELLADGRVRYTMKKPWRDGTLALVFEPEDLVARLCAMVPPPRWHLIRFHGVLAAHASLRPAVVPPPPPAPSYDATADERRRAARRQDAMEGGGDNARRHRAAACSSRARARFGPGPAAEPAPRPERRARAARAWIRKRRLEGKHSDNPVFNRCYEEPLIGL